MVSPIPHNVRPQHNVGRRRAKAAALLKSVAGDPQSVTFVDAAQYGSSDRFVAAVVDYRGNLLNAASVRGSSPALAKQVAVALALQSDRIGELYNIIHWTNAEQNKFKASNGHRLKRRGDPTAANSGTVEEI
ncbi:hypothetical protein MTO96_006262 [Rhipicephalus appendiculatus]